MFKLSKLLLLSALILTFTLTSNFFGDNMGVENLQFAENEVFDPQSVEVPV